MFHARPGGGASSAGDGWPTAGEGQAAGGIKFGSVEVAEARFPLFFGTHEFRPGSGGDGQYRGGAAVHLEMEIDEPARGEYGWRRRAVRRLRDPWRKGWIAPSLRPAIRAGDIGC